MQKTVTVHSHILVVYERTVVVDADNDKAAQEMAMEKCADTEEMARRGKAINHDRIEMMATVKP